LLSHFLYWWLSYFIDLMEYSKGRYC